MGRRTHLLVAMALLVSLALVAGTIANGQEGVPELSVPHSEGTALPVGAVFDPPQQDPPLHPSIPVWSHSEARPGAKMMQFQLTDIAHDGADPFRIEIVDGSGTVVETITEATLGERSSLWTNLGIGDSLGIRVFGNRAGGLAFTVARVSFDRAGRTLESITEPDERQHLFEYAGLHESAVGRVRGAVAKLSFMAMKNGELVRDVCTGFLVGDDLLMTNHHCVADAERCATTKAIFGFAWDAEGRTPGLKQYDCLAVERVDHDHDFALLRLAERPGEEWGRLAFAVTPPAEGQRVFILQHPAGEAKQISDLGCEVVHSIAPGRADDTDFSHACDTLGGSSGSPVIDANGDVVGLHHWGRMSFGRYALVNRAVRGERIVPLLEGLLEASQPAPDQPEQPEQPEPEQPEPEQPEPEQPEPSDPPEPDEPEPDDPAPDAPDSGQPASDGIETTTAAPSQGE